MSEAGAINVNKILQTLNQCGVEYLLIGGMNFALRHISYATYDIDIWIADNKENCLRCEKALVELRAEWGRSDDDWKPVGDHNPGWLGMQSIFCLTTAHGAVDVFRNVEGLEDWNACRARAYEGKTSAGVVFHGISDEDMLNAQYALEERDRNLERIRHLEQLKSGEENEPRRKTG